MVLNRIQTPLGLRARAAFYVFCLVVITGCGDAVAPSTAEPSPETGVETKTPEVTLATAEEIAQRLEAEKGKVVVVNFWATWCPPCVKEMPELVAFYEAHAGEELTFLSYTVDHPSTIGEAVMPFIEDQGLPFPVYVVNEPNPDPLMALLGGEFNGAVPATFVYNPEGEQVKAWFEETTAEALWAAAEPLLPSN